MLLYEILQSKTGTYKDNGGTLPCVSKNAKDEITIMSEGEDESGRHFYKVKTLQDNGWIRVNIFYDDGSTDEMFEH